MASVKTKNLLLVIVLTGASYVGCSATSGGGTGAGGAGGGAVGGSGGSAASGGGGGAGVDASLGGSAGLDGGAATGGGGATGGTGASGGGGGAGGWDFDGGWQVPDSGQNPPLVGDGGTTVVVGSGADASSAGKFGGSTSGAAPTIVYPADGVLVPPNTNSLEFHFIPGAGQTLFRFTFQAPTTTLIVYTGCTPVGAGCVFTPDAAFWSGLVAYARGAQPVAYTLSGVNGASPGVVGVSASRKIAFSEQDITGGIYYWNTAGAVVRYDFGFQKTPPKAYLTAANAGAIFCVGCHVLSRQGSTIAAGKDIPAPAPYTVFDVATTKPVLINGAPLGGTSNFSSFSPDGKHLLTSDGAKIGWQELYGGTIVNPTVVSPGTMPDWSPDGLHMVYAKPDKPPPFGFPSPGVSSASLETLHFNGTGWDAPTPLVPFAGQNNYYPTYSPTGDWVVFNRSPSNRDSYSNATTDVDAGGKPDGQLWVVAAKGGAAIALPKVNGGGNCQWPKWAPVLNEYYGGKTLWLTFSSERAYGLRLTDGQRTQLWMAGFDPAKAAAGQDPSLPPFWLPFQDMGSGNHIAQWVTEVVRKPCTSSTECASGEVCFKGRCNPA